MSQAEGIWQVEEIWQGSSTASHLGSTRPVLSLSGAGPWREPDMRAKLRGGRRGAPPPGAHPILLQAL